jgi:hypothetical protein
LAFGWKQVVANAQSTGTIKLASCELMGKSVISTQYPLEAVSPLDHSQLYHPFPLGEAYFNTIN